MLNESIDGKNRLTNYPVVMLSDILDPRNHEGANNPIPSIETEASAVIITANPISDMYQTPDVIQATIEDFSGTNLMESNPVSVKFWLSAKQSSKDVPNSSLDQGLEHTTCRQRLKERELEIKRLASRIRHAGGLVTDQIIQPSFSFQAASLSNDEIRKIAKIIETLEKQISATKDHEEQLKRHNDVLLSQKASDQSETDEVATKLKQEIQRQTSEKEKAEKIISKEVIDLEKLLKGIELLQSAERDNIDCIGDKNECSRPHQVAIMLGQVFKGTGIICKLRADIAKLEGDLKRKIRDMKRQEQSLGKAQAAQVNSEHGTAGDSLQKDLEAKNSAIHKLRQEVRAANLRISAYISEIDKLKGDLETKDSNVQDCLAKCMFLSISLVHSKTPYNSLETGLLACSGLSEPECEAGEGNDDNESFNNIKTQRANQKTPAPSSNMLAPQAPKKRRKGERLSTLKVLQKESISFQYWPTDTKKLNRPGF